MGWSAFAVLVALGLVAESYRQLRALRALRGRAQLTIARRGDNVGDPRARVADLNEVTIDVRAGLALAGQVPKSCAKAALSVGALAAILQSLQLVSGVQHAALLSGASGAVLSSASGAVLSSASGAVLSSASGAVAEAPLFFAPIASFLGGCVGALGCAWLGRTAEAEARRLRDDWTTLIQRATRDVSI